MILAWLIASAWADEGCTKIGKGSVLSVAAPAVIVLGERHGTQPDLQRAQSVVYRLQKRAEVTLALEAVHARYQSTLDSWADGRMTPEALPESLAWETSWGFPWKPYEALVTAAVWGGVRKVVGVGLDLGPPPPEAEFPVPTGYMALLADSMAGHEVAAAQQERFVRSMAWRDYSIAHSAVEAWNGEGYLVIVAGRGHVEGGKGIPWQADHMVRVPVHSFVLAWADPPCYDDDKVWRPTLLGELEVAPRL
jgi:uncharacterized iron-regulated protein